MDKETRDKITAQVLNDLDKATPQQRSQMLAEAVKFCQKNNLLTPQEQKVATSRENFQEAQKVAMKALLRMRLYQTNQYRRNTKKTIIMDKETRDRITAEVLNDLKRATPQEQGRMTAEAVKFCQKNNQLTPQELLLVAQGRQANQAELQKVVLKALLRMRLYQANQ